MQITFLVGNGFDLGAGLKTSYKDFCKWYIEQESGSEVIKKFKTDISKDLEAWADVEIELGQYTAEFSEKETDDFLDCLEDMRKCLTEYLKQQVKSFPSQNFTDSDVQFMRKGVLNFYKELKPSERNAFDTMRSENRGFDTRMKFISFNYTDCLDRFVEQVSAKPLEEWNDGTSRKFEVLPEVLHVHGKEDFYPILGVGEEKNIANKQMLEVPGFRQAMIKLSSVTYLGQPWYNQTVAEIQKSKILCIMGMSLGESDSHWWKKIIEWLVSDGSKHLIIFWHSKKPLDTISITANFRQENGVREKLLQYAEGVCSKNNQERIRERIHIVFNTKSVLKIPVVKKELATV